MWDWGSGPRQAARASSGDASARERRVFDGFADAA
jgi:hypothetical protein